VVSIVLSQRLLAHTVAELIAGFHFAHPMLASKGAGHLEGLALGAGRSLVDASDPETILTRGVLFCSRNRRRDSVI